MVLCPRVPDFAVIVAVYVNTGVPGMVLLVDALPPPHPTMVKNATVITANVKANFRRRCPENNKPEPRRTIVHGMAPGVMSTPEIDPAVTDAVVDIIAVTDATVP